MSALRRFALRLLNFIRPDRAEPELARELSAHAALLEEELERRGMTREAAAREARRALGDVVRTKERQRDARSFVRLEDLRRDLRYGLRTLARTPGFTCLAAGSLALGIGAVTVIYSMIHNVLLDPLPYPHSNRFVNVAIEDLGTGRPRRDLSVPEFLDFREQSGVFEDVIGTQTEGMLLTTTGRADFVRAVHVSPNFFDFMGLPPLIGRAFMAEDARPGAPSVAVLRHRAWVGIFGADPGVVGRTVQLDGQPRTIVGVMPARFTWHAADLWIPAPLEGAGTKVPRIFQARLKRGATIAQAEAQLGTIAARRARQHPGDYPPKFRVRAVYVIDSVVGSFRSVLYGLFAAVGLLMMIACCNVANMLLARATVREREMTVRAALGAGRARIVRQLLIESLLLALGGAALGCLLAYGGLGVLVPYLPQGPLPGEVDIKLNGPALAFSLATAVLAALVFGIAPALFSARHDLVAGLRGAGRGLAGGGRLRNGLVVAEIALSLVLLLPAGLLLRSFVSLASVELGFDPRNVLILSPIYPRGAYDGPAEAGSVCRRWLERLRALPGVEAAAMTLSVPPFGGRTAAVSVPGVEAAVRPAAMVHYCGDDFFRTIGVRIAQGRGFPEDAAQPPGPVAIVNRTFVRTYLPSGDALGREIRVTLAGTATPAVPAASVQIVGVVEDIRNQGVREPPAPAVYLPGIPDRMRPVILLRSVNGPAGLSRAIREELATIDPRLAMVQQVLADFLDRNTYAEPRFILIVVGVFGAVGLLLSAIGVYSVMSYTVSRQTQEIAVRMALGARRGQLCRALLGRAAALAAAGVVIGLAGNAATSRLIAGQLWNVTPHDALTLGSVVSLLMAVSLAACLVPARRAMKVEPMVALRRD